MKREPAVESIGVEKMIGIGKADGGTKQPSRNVSVTPGARCRQPLRTMTDQDYTRQMEERYGILDEGAF